jgi:hypothetical protein
MRALVSELHEALIMDEAEDVVAKANGATRASPAAKRRGRSIEISLIEQIAATASVRSL